MHASLTSDLLLAQSSNGQLSQSNESGAILEDIIAREMKKLEEISKLQKGKKQGINFNNKRTQIQHPQHRLKYNSFRKLIHDCLPIEILHK